MSTYDDFKSLQTYLKSNVGCNVKLGEQDIDPGEYPLIIITPDEPSTIDVPKNVNLVSYQFGMKIKLVDTREPETLIKTLSMFDKFVESINNFQPQRGHLLDEDFTPEYTDNTYEVTFRYLMKFQRQKNIGG